MSNNPLIYDTPATTMMNALTVLLNSGFIAVYTGSQPSLDGALTGTQLVEMQFGSTAFGNAFATAGVVTANANAISPGTASNTGTAGYFALLKSDNSTVVATGSVGTSGADLNLTNLSITSGVTVQCPSFSLTQAQ